MYLLNQSNVRRITNFTIFLITDFITKYYCNIIPIHTCKDTICFQSPKKRSMAQRAQNNKIVESEFEIELSMS